MYQIQTEKTVDLPFCSHRNISINGRRDFAHGVAQAMRSVNLYFGFCWPHPEAKCLWF